MTDFKNAAQLGAYVSKDYAEDFFKLLVNYQDISASEAASRLGLHIRTAQDFLDGLATLQIVEKEEVHEKKRPYFRYSLIKQSITLKIDLHKFIKEHPGEGLERLVREKENSGVNFSVARGGNQISGVTVWEGEGRERQERRINLTTPQGKFLYHLPFPKAKPLTILEIMKKAEITEEYAAEIQDVIEELEQLEVVEYV
jgi:predicted transcriptional regulator